MKKKKVEVQENPTPEELENIQMDEMPNPGTESSQNPELSEVTKEDLIASGFTVVEEPEILVPDPEKYVSGVDPNNPEPMYGGEPDPTPPEAADEFANMSDEWKERNKIPVEERSTTMNAPSSDEPMSSGLMTEEGIRDHQEAINPKIYWDQVGMPVTFENSAAIITKVWGNGLVNLIVFHDGSPVPDLKTSVPYGEGPNTWKEIN